MKIESTQLTDADFHEFLGGYMEIERAQLIERLRGIADAADEIVAALDANPPSAGNEWSPLETLAHMATSAAYFGWAIHEVSQGKEIGAQMLDVMRMRDPAIVEAVKQPPQALAAELRKALTRTAAFLEKTPYEQLRTTIEFASRRLSAEDFTRLTLVHHMEGHLDQIRAGMPGASGD